MDTLKYLFKSLFNNQTIVDGRKRPWYWAVLLFILSLGIVISPVLSKGYTDNGTSFLQPSVEQGLGTGLVELSKNADFEELSVDNSGNLDPKTGSTFKTKANLTGHGAINGESLKSMYETPYTYSTEAQSGTEVTVLIAYYLGGQDFNSASVRSSFATTYIPTDAKLQRSFIVFSDSTFMIGISSSLISDARSYSYFVGMYDQLKGFSFKDLKSELKPAIDATTNQKNEDSYVNVWSPFITKSYLTTRNKNTWVNVGINLGVFSSAVLIVGLIIFLFSLSRKNLLHKDCNLWQTEKMAATMGLTCAIISAVASAFNPIYGMVFGPMALLMRMMFMIMKLNNGGGTSSQKPLYQAR